MAGLGGKKQFQFFTWRKVEIRHPLATAMPVNPKEMGDGSLDWMGIDSVHECSSKVVSLTKRDSAYNNAQLRDHIAKDN